MSSNLPPGCARLPGEEDDGVTDLQEAVLGFLEDETMLPTIINDSIIELVIFHEKTDPVSEVEYAEALAKKLRSMAGRIEPSPTPREKP